MVRRRNPIIQALTLVLSLGFGWFTACLPITIVSRMGAFLGSLAYWIVPRIRRIGRANLDLAYGDALTPKEKDQILRASARNVGRVAAEFSHIPRVFSRNFRKHIVAIEGLEHIQSGGPRIIISAHIGNWEWICPSLNALGFKIAAVTRPLSPPALDDYVNAIRRTGYGTIPKHKASTEMVRHLKEGWLLGILIDQNPHEHGVPATYFGRKTWCTVGPALLVRFTHAPVHLTMVQWIAPGKYILKISPPIPMLEPSNTPTAILENTQRCQNAIENLVRSCPEQWLWFHQRWRERPRLEKEWTERMSVFLAKSSNASGSEESPCPAPGTASNS